MIAVDDILHDFIDEKISQIKSDPSLLNTIFEGKPVEKIESFKQYLSNTHIRTVYHHPRDATEWPCYAIVLQSNNESDQVIGSSGDAYDEVLISRMEDGWIGSDSVIHPTHVAAVESIESNPNLTDEEKAVRIESYDAYNGLKQFYSALEVKDGRRSCHVTGAKGTTRGKGIWIDFQNSVLGGYVSLTGKNYVTFWIKSNRVGNFLQFGFGERAHNEHTYSFTVSTIGLWERIRIDIRGLPDRAKDVIRYMSFRITNDSEYTDVFIDALKGEKSAGEVYEETYLDNSYRIESWSENAELTLGMHQILLWNILKYRTYFEISWGLMRQRVEGGDIMPQPELYPAFVYVRGLVYTCTTIELVPRETDLAALEVKVGRMEFG